MGALVVRGVTNVEEGKVGSDGKSGSGVVLGVAISEVYNVLCGSDFNYQYQINIKY